MHAYQLAVLIDELRQPRYAGLSPEQAYGRMVMDNRYEILRQTVFLSREEANFRRTLGVLEHPYRMVSADDAGQFPEGMPGMPAPLPWATFLQAWQLAQHH